MLTDEHLIQIGVKRFGDQQKCLIALRAVPKSNWGVGNCWEHLEDGMCMCCGGAHPKLQLRILSVFEVFETRVPLRRSAEVFETRVQHHVKNKQVGELARRRPTPCADADRPFYVGPHSA